MPNARAEKFLVIRNDADFLKAVNFDLSDFAAEVKIFYDGSASPSRYASWEHCHDAFRKAFKAKKKTGKKPDPDSRLALHLAFYMASWGMYRGSSFLLQYDYTIYKELVPKLFAERFDDLWDLDKKLSKNLSEKDAEDIAQKIADLFKVIEEHFINYKQRCFPQKEKVSRVSQTLVTKIVLGTIGCYPALDRYFRKAIGAGGKEIYSGENAYRKDCIKVMLRLAKIVEANRASTLVFDAKRPRYPVMKLIDMYCFAKGGGKEEEEKTEEE